MKGKKTLVAYYSATGNTERAAKLVAEATGGTLYAIRPVQPYTAADLDWHDQSSRSTREMADPQSRPAIVGDLEQAGSYEVVYIGFPIWWGIAPRVIQTFLENSDLAGKTVAVQAGTVGNWLAEMDEDYAYNFDDDGNVLLDEPILGAPKTVTKLSSGLMAIQQVKNGQADAVILDKLPAKTIVEKLNAEGGNQLKILDMSVYDDAYAFAIGEGNTALKAWIDEALTELKEEGFFEELNSKWFGSEEE